MPGPRPAPMRARSGVRWAVPVALAAIAGLLLVGFMLISSGGSSNSNRSGSGSKSTRDGQRTRAERSTTSPSASSPTSAQPAPSAAGAGSEPSAGTTPGRPVFGGGNDAAQGATLNDQGYALSQQGNDAAAVPILQRAVASFPEGSSGHPYDYAVFNLGHSLRASGRPAEAIPYLERRLAVSSFERGVVQRELALARQQAARG
jgi:tetratricopeptide (TPR) repeat protein